MKQNIREKGLSFCTWGVNTSVGNVALVLGWGAVPLANFLAAAGVVLNFANGAYMLAEQLNLPKYPDYIATDGKYGDIYDTINHNAYVRVIFNVGTSKYISGLSSNGTFSYVKKGYTGVKSDSELINQTQSLFNSCIVAYGYNALYRPA